MTTRFPLAPMSRGILALTLVLLVLPVAFFAGAAAGNVWLAPAGLMLAAIYAWVWLRFRPMRFVVGPRAVEVIWPLKHRQIPRADIVTVRLIGNDELKREIGWCIRIGAGGLWGGFGWLWTRRRGSRPWLITPEDPEAFVRALANGRAELDRAPPD